MCVQGAVELLAPRAHEKGLEIAWTIDPELPSSVIGDEARVRQILLNLIGNAVKFTERGGVLVRVLSSAADGHLRFTVKDTGPGIAPHALDALFSEFERLESRASRRQDGTGLGLAISKRLARAMDGDITVASTVGRGATFTAELALPAAAGAQPFHRTLPAIVEPRIRRAALALDRLIERRAIGDMLAAAGVTVEELDIDATPSAPIDALVVDTEEDPAAAGRLLAQARLIAGDAPVRGIVLIGTSSRSGLRNFRAHGFDSYLVRPVRPQSLVALLGAQATEHRIADATEDASGDFPARRGSEAGPLRVLLAEDNPINALLAVSMLEKEGCTTVVAADGRRAVEAVQASLTAGGVPFDIVLMDVHMPEMDGLEAARLLCDIDRDAHRVPPIVALTANAFPEDRARCLAAGMSDYLAKPFDRAQLQRTLQRWCDPGRPQRDDRGAAA